MLSLSAPGIPSASLYIMVPVLISVGLPAEGVGILIALDVLPDIVKTIMNVTADLTAATVISVHSGGEVRSQARTFSTQSQAATKVTTV